MSSNWDSVLIEFSFRLDDIVCPFKSYPERFFCLFHTFMDSRYTIAYILQSLQYMAASFFSFYY